MRCLAFLIAFVAAGCDLVEDPAVLLSTFGTRSILSREVGGGTDVILDDAGGQQVLFSYCDLDCNERIREHDWSASGLHHAFRITNSNRYRSTHRLLLYSFTQPRARALVDYTATRVQGFRYTDSTFVYMLEDGRDVTVRLE